MKNILVINAGSSSLKYQFLNMADESIIAKGQVERIGLDESKISHTPKGGEKVIYYRNCKDHTQAMKLVIENLTHEKYGVIKDLSGIYAVGHRVLHGGEEFSAPALVDDEVKAAIRDNIELGPLHNPANLMGIEACQHLMPGVPNVAVFDTAFHQTMEPKAFMYAVPYEYYEKYHVRRYGFHGTSHRYVSARAAEFLGRPASELKLVTCHLGNGSSLCAVRGGKCVDTSMGLTPLAGVPMGTRSGDVDAALVETIMNKTGMSVPDTLTLLNKKSGMLGVSGVSSDFRDLTDAEEAGNPRAILALHMFAYQVAKYIGAYTVAMGGLDAVVFTGGVGENDWPMREKIMGYLEFLGCKIDLEKNARKSGEYYISTEESTVKAVVLATDEELMIARDTMEIVKNN